MCACVCLRMCVCVCVCVCCRRKQNKSNKPAIDSGLLSMQLRTGAHGVYAISESSTIIIVVVAFVCPANCRFSDGFLPTNCYFSVSSTKSQVVLVTKSHQSFGQALPSAGSAIPFPMEPNFDPNRPLFFIYFFFAFV